MVTSVRVKSARRLEAWKQAKREYEAENQMELTMDDYIEIAIETEREQAGDSE